MKSPRSKIPYLTASCILITMIQTTAPIRADESAAKSDPAILTLDRIFADEEFKEEEFSAKWLEGHEGYTFLEKAASESESKSKPDSNEEDNSEIQEIWRTVPGKQPALMVAVSDLVPPDADKPLAIDDYAFSKDLSLLLIYTNSKRVWRKKTRGDYWLLDRTSGELRQLGGDARPSSLMFAKISPTGHHARLCARTEHLPRRSPRPLHPSPHHDRLRRHHQRDRRLGLRGGTLRARRFSLESRRRRHRILAFRRERRPRPHPRGLLLRLLPEAQIVRLSQGRPAQCRLPHWRRRHRRRRNPLARSPR